MPIIWTASRKIKAGPARQGAGRLCAAGAALALLAAVPATAAPSPPGPACHLEHEGLTIDVRHTPPTPDWGATLEITVADGVLPLTRMVAAENASVDGCTLAEPGPATGFALVIRLAGTPAAGPRVRIFDWRDGRLQERDGQ